MDGAYILADGRDVPHRSPLARWEMALLAEHISEMLGMAREQRAARLADITRSCGVLYAEKLREAYAEAHHAKRKEAQHG